MSKNVRRMSKRSCCENILLDFYFRFGEVVEDQIWGEERPWRIFMLGNEGKVKYSIIISQHQSNGRVNFSSPQKGFELACIWIFDLTNGTYKNVPNCKIWTLKYHIRGIDTRDSQQQTKPWNCVSVWSSYVCIHLHWLAPASDRWLNL